MLAETYRKNETKFVPKQYAILAFFAILFGPIAGAAIGLIGHALIDFTLYGPWWSWIIASAVAGLLIGILGRKVDVENGEFTVQTALWFNLANVVANLVSWILIAPILDILIYQEPVGKVFTQGVIAGAANIVTTAIVGTLLLYGYAQTRTKKGSLKME